MMDVGIGLPNSVRGVDRRGIVEWARNAESAGFASLGTIDRLAYPSHEPLAALAAAAAEIEPRRSHAAADRSAAREARAEASARNGS